MSSFTLTEERAVLIQFPFLPLILWRVNFFLVRGRRKYKFADIKKKLATFILTVRGL